MLGSWRSDLAETLRDQRTGRPLGATDGVIHAADCGSLGSDSRAVEDSSGVRVQTVWVSSSRVHANVQRRRSAFLGADSCSLVEGVTLLAEVDDEG